MGRVQRFRAGSVDAVDIVSFSGTKSEKSFQSPLLLQDCVGCKRCETACPTDGSGLRHLQSPTP